jgi:hypothetical protein
MEYANNPMRRVLRFAAFALGTLLVIQFLFTRSGVFRAVEAAPPNSRSAEVAVSAEAAESAAEKLRQIQEASDSGADGFLTEFSETEVNSYLAYEMAPRYPAGVSNVQVRFLPGRILGTSEVDFDKAKAARGTPGGMSDYLFWGEHAVAAEGGFSAIDGVGHFDLESVAVDGVTLPQSVVDLLIQTFLKPRFPRLALDVPFFLPNSVDRVQVMRESIEVEINPPASR